MPTSKASFTAISNPAMCRSWRATTPRFSTSAWPSFRVRNTRTRSFSGAEIASWARWTTSRRTDRRRYPRGCSFRRVFSRLHALFRALRPAAVSRGHQPGEDPAATKRGTALSSIIASRTAARPYGPGGKDDGEGSSASTANRRGSRRRTAPRGRPSAGERGPTANGSGRHSRLAVVAAPDAGTVLPGRRCGLVLSLALNRREADIPVCRAMPGRNACPGLFQTRNWRGNTVVGRISNPSAVARTDWKSVLPRCQPPLNHASGATLPVRVSGQSVKVRRERSLSCSVRRAACSPLSTAGRSNGTRTHRQHDRKMLDIASRRSNI